MALVAIMLWYIVIGVLAAIGTTTITRSQFSPRVEQVFFALLLVPVAGMYLTFIGYFGDSSERVKHGKSRASNPPTPAPGDTNSRGSWEVAGT